MRIGGLKTVVSLVKTFGMVNATAEFLEHFAVIDGLMFDVFGERGIGTRSAVGFISLPFGIAVEIEAEFEINLEPYIVHFG